jgi:hypothetical protein
MVVPVVEQKWTYMLRILRRNPDQIRMDRLAEYMRELALMIGAETNPVFKGIKKASTGLKVAVPASKRDRAWHNVQLAKQNPESKPARHLRAIEGMLSDDLIKTAQLLDSSEKVVYVFNTPQVEEFAPCSVKQAGEVDGVVTGLVGADDTMHLHVRDYASRDFRLVVKDEALARLLLTYFRRGVLRFKVYGTWQRTEDGWVPETSKCVVEAFEVLDEALLVDIFHSLASVADNGWKDFSDPMAIWRDIRGVH